MLKRSIEGFNIGENLFIGGKAVRGKLLEVVARKRSEMIGSRIIADNKLIRNLPTGRLECHRRGSGYRWYVVKNGKREYLNKKKRGLAQRLAYKRTLKDEVEDLKNEKILIDCFLENMERLQKGMAIIITPPMIEKDHRCHRENAEVDRLAKEYYDEKNPRITAWETEEYPHLEDFKENRRTRSLSGHCFASKDEAMIDDALKRHGLLVRYDELLYLQDKKVYPDFHILDPKTGKDIYWEHFGMMDIYEYREHNIKKLKKYIESGYYPMINFITTFMGDPYRIDEQWIETVIENFFEI